LALLLGPGGLRGEAGGQYNNHNHHDTEARHIDSFVSRLSIGKWREKDEPADWQLPFLLSNKFIVH
jgi:hypothetical protein